MHRAYPSADRSHLLECVVNVSEGRRADVIGELAGLAGPALLDVHRDPDHNRAVLTLVGEGAPMAVAAGAVERLDLRAHTGAHPRIGVVDVVPFVPLGTSTMADAVAARDRFASWAGEALGLPCFLYGPERSLPDVRRTAFVDLAPDTGPPAPHPTAGACAVGARPPLVAYNVWLDGADLPVARAIARELRGRSVRALGLEVGSHVQVSMNLVEPDVVGPDAVYDEVAARASVARAELVGLLPDAVLRRVDPARWAELDLNPERTIESRLAGI
jgi:glutamate formiminotransferase/glutamate formiminotransferase/formiminotetrahydrofolate cyclodeaminase